MKRGISTTIDLSLKTSPKQMLACNPQLLAAARAHSQWMIDTDTFSHTGANGTDPGQRMTAAGYVFSGSWAWGENISWQGSTSASPDLEAFARAIHDNLFLSPGHRANICNNAFDELGPGLRDGVFTSGGTNYNSLLGTQNFAASGNTPGPMLLGVAYYDFEGDNLYDPGEGIAGVSVNATGAAPGAKGHEIAPGCGAASFSGNNHLVFSFRRRAGAGSGATESGYTIDGITYTIENSATLEPGSWQTGPSVIQQTGVTPNGDGSETVSVRLLAPLGPRQFVRLRVTQN